MNGWKRIFDMGEYENYTESELLEGSPVHSTRKPHDATEGERIPVRRGGVTEVCVYDVLEYELETLISGSDDNIWLNFAIGFASIFVSFLISLLTTTMSDRLFTLFTVITVCCAIAAFVTFVMWRRTHKKHRQFINKIKGRLKVE